MIEIAKRYITYLRLKREFKKTHKQVVTIHSNGVEEWATIRWELR